MNKKLIMMTTSLAVGGSLLFGTAFASTSQLSGYDTYKKSILSTKDLKNGTADVKVSVTDNGSDLLDVSSNVKINLNANAMSETTSIKSGSVTKTSNMYRQNGEMIQKSSDSDVFTVRQNTRKNNTEATKTENPEVTNAVVALVDTLVGSMQNNVAVADNSDGTKKVTVNLNENDVTPLINALTSVAVVGSTNRPVHNEKAGEINLKSILPQIASDVKIESVSVTGDINSDDTIKDQVAKVVISGKDAAGKSHEITINASLDLSNINNTTPDTVDLTGKQVKTIAAQFRGRD
jgi:hypothetical protein